MTVPVLFFLTDWSPGARSAASQRGAKEGAA